MKKRMVSTCLDARGGKTVSGIMAQLKEEENIL
jgi:hypothetical protein